MLLTEDYRHYLKTVFADRRQRNPSYSLRGFARDIGLPVSRVSELLRHKRHLSTRSAATVAKKLNLNESETRRFLQTVAAGLKRGPVPSASRIDSVGENMTLDVFAILADWSHYAILELVDTVGFQHDASWIAKRLGIPKFEVQMAIGRLQKVGLLEEDDVSGELRVFDEYSISPSDIPSEAIRKHHRQLMKKADEALDFVPLDEREISTTIFALDERDLPAAKKMLRKFRRDMAELLAKRKKKNRVYSLGIQMIPLDLKPEVKQEKEKSR